MENEDFQQLQMFMKHITETNMEERTQYIKDILRKENEDIGEIIRFSIQKMTAISKYELISKFCATSTEMWRKIRMKKALFEQFEEQTLKFESVLYTLQQNYMSLLRDPTMISIITEIELKEKLNSFKICLSRTIDSYIRMTSKSHFKKPMSEQLARKKSLENSMEASKNCKIELENTIELQMWLLDNFSNPYLDTQKKLSMATKSGLNENQVNNWFINARERVIKKIAKRSSKEYKKQSQQLSSSTQKLYKKKGKEKQTLIFEKLT